MSCCTVHVGGWRRHGLVGWWVGGWVFYLVVLELVRPADDFPVEDAVFDVALVGGWVGWIRGLEFMGGWVGGWVGGLDKGLGVYRLGGWVGGWVGRGKGRCG